MLDFLKKLFCFHDWKYSNTTKIYYKDDDCYLHTEIKCKCIKCENIKIIKLK